MNAIRPASASGPWAPGQPRLGRARMRRPVGSGTVTGSVVRRRRTSRPRCQGQRCRPRRERGPAARSGPLEPQIQRRPPRHAVAGAVLTSPGAATRVKPRGAPYRHVVDGGRQPGWRTSKARADARRVGAAEPAHRVTVELLAPPFDVGHQPQMYSTEWVLRSLLGSWSLPSFGMPWTVSPPTVHPGG